MAVGENIFRSELSQTMFCFLASSLSIGARDRAIMVPTAVPVPEKKFQRLEPTAATAAKPLSPPVLTLCMSNAILKPS